MKTLALTVLTLFQIALLVPTPARAASPPHTNVKVCVRIEQKSFSEDGTRPVPAPPETTKATEAPTPPANVGAFPRENQPTATGEPPPSFEGAADALPPPSPALRGRTDLVSQEEADLFTINPTLYLRRLIEYHVTHEPGFESVTKGCSQTIVVELYPVRHGWTVFARYSGNEREEKIDVVQLDELGTFAERATQALLRDKTITETLTRTTVLRADSEAKVRKIETHSHLLLGMGSSLRFGMLPTAPNAIDPAVERFRVETPLTFAIGARNKFRAWALDATGRLDVGLVQRASRENQGGGNVDYSVGFGFGLGFLAYADPDAVNTFYYGGGGSFELIRYQSLGARAPDGGSPSPSGLWGGGLNVDAILGYEFMRTSTLHFFVQGTLSAPAYVFDSQNEQSQIQAYIPGLTAQLGLLF